MQGKRQMRSDSYETTLSHDDAREASEAILARIVRDAEELERREASEAVRLALEAYHWWNWSNIRDTFKQWWMYVKRKYLGLKLPGDEGWKP